MYKEKRRNGGIHDESAGRSTRVGRRPTRQAHKRGERTTVAIVGDRSFASFARLAAAARHRVERPASSVPPFLLCNSVASVTSVAVASVTSVAVASVTSVAVASVTSVAVASVTSVAAASVTSVPFVGGQCGR
jgi:hypothetical protein